MTLGFVRDTKGMESIAQTMIQNVHRLAANTYLMGHTESDPSYYFKDHKINKKEQERFWDNYAIDERGQARISDYGLKPLQELAFQLQKTFKPEKQLQIVDRMFNICHQRSDLPSFFIEGGTQGLNELFGRPTDIEAYVKINWYKKAQHKEYPIANPIVSGFHVLSDVPNTSSIQSSLNNYTILPHIREIPMSDFNITGQSYSVSENKHISTLTDELRQSKQIKPLIIVIDSQGPYILEGSHRIDALYRLGIKTFPALVVMDKENELV